MKRGYIITLVVSSVALILFWLWNREPPREPLASVAGTITFDGRPVEKGLIEFLPLNEGSLMRMEIRGGEYSGEGVVGKARVLITSPTETIPDRFNLMSRLRAEIKPGSNHFDFQLDSKPPPPPKLSPPPESPTEIASKGAPNKEASEKEAASKDAPGKDSPAAQLSPPSSPAQASPGSSDYPALMLMVWTCQGLAILVLIVEIAGAFSLILGERALPKKTDAAAEPQPEKQATPLWNKIALLVGGAICIVALLTTAEMIRLVIRMDQRMERMDLRGDRIEQRIDFMSRTPPR